MLAGRAARGCEPGGFAERAGVLGIDFAEPIPQQIHVIRDSPRYPGADGVSRVVVPSDEDLVAEWLLEFSPEALPHEPEPDREKIQNTSHDSQHMFWTVNNLPVSIAGAVRQTKHGVAIGNVYTLPSIQTPRIRGLISVTAALVETCLRRW